MKKMRIGIVGCGDISGIYLKNLTEMYHEVEVVHVCDVVAERVEAAAKEYSIARHSTDMKDLMNDPDVDIVLNLGRTFDHYAISEAALNAGKHVYSEKPLGITLEEGKKLIALAKEKGLHIGCAPDTFLGGAFQTCRKIIESGMIGDLVGASAFMVCRGHESWHPNPGFYYKPGGGPMLDMGPYYITTLINLMGGIKRVTGMARKTFPVRTITSQPHYGDTIDVEVDTHVNGLMEFENGAIGSILTTFDVYNSKAPSIEIYGTEGTLQVPDPDWFGGEIKLYRPETEEYSVIPSMFPYDGNCRGLGLADMAKAIQTGREIRVSGERALHVLEVMCGFIKSSEEHRHIDIETPYTKPALMKSTAIKGILD